MGRSAPVVQAPGERSIRYAALAAAFAVHAATTSAGAAQILGPVASETMQGRQPVLAGADVRREVMPLAVPRIAGPGSRSTGAGSRAGLFEESETIERVSGEAKGPRIPEPMVFDLVRPLGARQGEAEANVLGLIPLGRKTRTVDGTSDPLGLVRRSPDTQGFEWAPEIEWVVTDGLALELELPLENARLEAYKAAAQVTFGTAFGHRVIHGAQAILQYDRDPKLWTTAWLYLAGLRLSDTWSLFGMVGPRFEAGDAAQGANAEILGNLTLFADLTDRLVAGMETNYGQVINGQAAVLVMPQVHYEVGKYWMMQVGAGVRFTSEFTLPEVGFRLIREF